MVTPLGFHCREWAQYRIRMNAFAPGVLLARGVGL
jgi:hypothetical protein